MSNQPPRKPLPKGKAHDKRPPGSDPAPEDTNPRRAGITCPAVNASPRPNTPTPIVFTDHGAPTTPTATLVRRTAHPRGSRYLWKLSTWPPALLTFTATPTTNRG